MSMGEAAGDGYTCASKGTILRLHRSIHASMPLRTGSPSVVADYTDEERTRRTPRGKENKGKK